MKKTLLATAIAGAMVYSVTSAQAATVYDQDGTRMDVYGRIAMGVRSGGPEFDSDENEIDNGPEFVNVYSRLGLTLSNQISNDLRAFGRVEWRFTGDEQDTSSGFSEVRQSYLGLESAQFGTVQAGNFDAFHNQFVSIPFDVYIDRGLEFAGHPTQSRGDSIGYFTPDLSGFTAYLQAKYYSERGWTEEEQQDRPEGDVIATQGGVKYETGPLRLALGYVDDVIRGGGNGEMLYGASGSYAINENFSARLGYETRDNNDDLADNSATFTNGYDSVGIGMSYSMGQLAFNVDYYNIDLDNAGSRNAWAAGSYYKLSDSFNVFLELNDGDAPSVDRETTLGDLTDEVYVLTGARYMF